MKKFIVSVIVLLSIVPLYAQSLNDSNNSLEHNAENTVSREDGIIHISEVVQVPSLKQDVLFSNALLWISGNINTPKAAIQTENQQAGLITLKSTLPAFTEDTWFEFTMAIQVKDGRYKYDISNINYCLSAKLKKMGEDMGETFTDKPIDEIVDFKQASNWKVYTYSKFSTVIDTLKKGMSKNNDW